MKYRNEEELLAGQDNPQKYNDEVLFPDKVRINIEYLDNWSFWNDIKIIFIPFLEKICRILLFLLIPYYVRK
mgnify:FL=1